MRDSSFRDSSLGDSSNRDTILSDVPRCYTDTLKIDKSNVKSDVTPSQANVPLAAAAGNDYHSIITICVECYIFDDTIFQIFVQKWNMPVGQFLLSISALRSAVCCCASP